MPPEALCSNLVVWHKRDKGETTWPAVIIGPGPLGIQWEIQRFGETDSGVSIVSSEELESFTSHLNHVTSCVGSQPGRIAFREALKFGRSSEIEKQRSEFESLCALFRCTAENEPYSETPSPPETNIDSENGTDSGNGLRYEASRESEEVARETAEDHLRTCVEEVERLRVSLSISREKEKEAIDELRRLEHQEKVANDALQNAFSNRDDAIRALDNARDSLYEANSVVDDKKMHWHETQDKVESAEHEVLSYREAVKIRAEKLKQNRLARRAAQVLLKSLSGEKGKSRVRDEEAGIDSDEINSEANGSRQENSQPKDDVHCAKLSNETRKKRKIVPVQVIPHDNLYDGEVRSRKGSGVGSSSSYVAEILPREDNSEENGKGNWREASKSGSIIVVSSESNDDEKKSRKRVRKRKRKKRRSRRKPKVIFNYKEDSCYDFDQVSDPDWSCNGKMSSSDEHMSSSDENLPAKKRARTESGSSPDYSLHSSSS